jgi:3-dehydroquinate synthase
VPDVLAEVVRRSVELKAGVVERDEKEAGLRRVLNYGHTIGHVVETCTGYGAWRHGEAVAVGMDFAARLAQRMGLCSAELVRRQRALLERLGLPWTPPAIAPAKVTRTMALDKKVARGRVHFVLPEDLGRVRIEPVEADAVAALWREGGRAARGRRP